MALEFRQSIIIAAFFLLYQPFLHAQNKNDFIWILGSPNSTTDPYYGGDYIDFSNGNPNIEYINPPLDLWYPSIISNEDGQLVFYNNGCKIMGANHQLIENGDEINFGFIHNTYCNFPNHPVGYPWYQGNLTLPYPGHSGEYFLFHMRINEEYIMQDLLYSHIDMTANNGAGEVTAKNQILLQDTFSWALTGTRHANGRDWWIIAARDVSPKYYLYLLDPQGIHAHNIQQPEDFWIPGQVLTASNIFSPDGSKYVRLGGEIPADFKIYDFDRCSGTISNPITVHIPDSSSYTPWACFSPNSRFLYVQNWGERLYQYDTWATDINASVQLIGVYDGFLGRNDRPATFNSMTVGPDQRIYMSCKSGTNYLHTIHKPDELGLDCDFRQHDIELPAHFPFYLPNMPFYRLYNLKGSACDTLGVEPPIVAFWRSEQDSMMAPTLMNFTDISYSQPTSWLWYFGDGATSTEQSPTHSYGAPGTYDVCLIVCNVIGLCDTLCREIEIKSVSTINPLESESSSVRIFPNPTQDYLVLSLQNYPASVSLRIFDMQGREVLRKSINSTVGVERLDVQTLSSGLYFLSLSFGNKFWSGRFIKSSSPK